MRLTNSFEIELIPGTVKDVDKKGYTWTISSINADTIDLEFNFEYPDYISMGDRADYISIRFYNTPLYLVPLAKDK